MIPIPLIMREFSPTKGHILTGRVLGQMQYYFDLCKYGPEIADKMHPRFANPIDHFKAGLHKKNEKGNF